MPVLFILILIAITYPVRADEMHGFKGLHGLNTYHPTFAGLQGPSIHLPANYRSSSPEELWQIKEVDHHLKTLPLKGVKLQALLPDTLTLEQHIDLVQIDRGLLNRSSLRVENNTAFLGRFAAGYGFRFNLTHNLEQINSYRGRSALPVRSDTDVFAEQNVALDKLYLSYLTTLRPDLHLGITGGYLEEQYAGIGGEVLYRPFGKNWAIGAEAWEVMKRDPLTPLNQGLSADHLLTGHINAYYQMPFSPGTSLHAKAGRYLAEDLGATLMLSHRFDNGAILNGFFTMTNQADTDIYGDKTRIDHGLKLSVPLGSLKPLPIAANLEVKTHAIGRQTGQNLDNPLRLYDLTEPFSLQHIAKHW